MSDIRHCLVTELAIWCTQQGGDMVAYAMLLHYGFSIGLILVLVGVGLIVYTEASHYLARRKDPLSNNRLDAT